MSFIKGIEKCEFKLHDWLQGNCAFRPAEFQIIDALRVYHDPDGDIYSNPKLELFLIRPLSRNSTMVLEFEGVHNLTCNGVVQKGNHCSQLMGFVIEDVSSEGWEHIGIKAYDYEHNRISFLARRCTLSEFNWGEDL